jgi:HSP20 family protein
MRNGGLLDTRRSFDELVNGLFNHAGQTWPAGGYNVPTDVFHTDDELFIRMDLPGVDPEDVEVTVQENVLVINGRRNFTNNAENIRYVRRGAFYGDFTQRVSLGKGLSVDDISARFDRGVLEVAIPYAPEVQPKKISIQVGDQPELSS